MVIANLSLNNTEYWNYLKRQLNIPELTGQRIIVSFVNSADVIHTIMRKIRHLKHMEVLPQKAAQCPYYIVNNSSISTEYRLVFFNLSKNVDYMEKFESLGIDRYTLECVWYVATSVTQRKYYEAEIAKLITGRELDVRYQSLIDIGCEFCTHILWGRKAQIKFTKQKEGRLISLNYCPMCGRHLPQREEVQKAMEETNYVLEGMDNTAE